MSEEKSLKTHKDLEVWNKAVDLVTEIYLATNSFPKREIYGITSQLRRSSVSIPSNIAEGAARASKKEFSQFLSIALGSISETETQLIIARNLHYINDNNFHQLEDRLIHIRKMTLGLKKYINAKS